METPPLTFIKQLRSVTLSDTERASLRTRLVARMRETGVQRPVLSPWPRLMHAKRFQAAILSLIIIVSYGSSVTLAAEGSLPGDILYPIKTRVTEPVARLVIATSPAAEATFETRLLEKRLEEAETLDAREKLDPELRQAVRAGIREQSMRTGKKIKDVENAPVASTSFVATSTSGVAASSSEVISEKHDQNRGNDDDDAERNQNEHVLRGVREKHKRILEKLDLVDAEDDNREERD